MSERYLDQAIAVGSRASPATGGWGGGGLWKGMVGQAREGTSNKTGVGRTKDNGAVTVQRKSPGTPCGAGHLGLTQMETQRGRLWTA